MVPVECRNVLKCPQNPWNKRLESRQEIIELIACSRVCDILYSHLLSCHNSSALLLRVDSVRSFLEALDAVVCVCTNYVSKTGVKVLVVTQKENGSLQKTKIVQ